MEFRIDRSALTDAVAWAARVLPTRSPVPVLGGLLLEADSGLLRISGLDYEASACIEVEAETMRAGRVLVMGRRLLDVCRVLPESPVVCAVEVSRFSVTGGGARFGLSVLPLDDYPALPPLPGVLGAVDSEEFAAAVAHVAVAAGRDDTLPTLTGIRVGLDDETMTLAATDRYRFAVRTLAWKAGDGGCLGRCGGVGPAPDGDRPLLRPLRHGQRRPGRRNGRLRTRRNAHHGPAPGR